MQVMVIERIIDSVRAFIKTKKEERAFIKTTTKTIKIITTEITTTDSLAIARNRPSL